MERQEQIIKGFLEKGIEIAKEENFFEILKTEILKLEDPSKTVLLKRYGFDSDAQTLQSVAEELGLEREEVRQIEYNAYREIVKILKKYNK